jgi:hypothetical protein
MTKIIPNVTFLNESQVNNFIKLINEDKKCTLFDNKNEDVAYVLLFFIIKEIYEYLNIKTYDNILISKLRVLLIQQKDYDNKINTLKSFLVNNQEEQKFSK